MKDISLINNLLNVAHISIYLTLVVHVTYLEFVHLDFRDLVGTRVLSKIFIHWWFSFSSPFHSKMFCCHFATLGAGVV